MQYVFITTRRMYFYPTVLPNLNRKKLKSLEKYSSQSTLLYSDEGLFQVKNGKLYQVHFIDDENAKRKNIGTNNFICDNSEIKWTSSNKLPFSFKRKDIMVYCYEKGSVKLYIEEDNEKPSNVYFYVKDESIYGIEDDIAQMMECAK